MTDPLPQRDPSPSPNVPQQRVWLLACVMLAMVQVEWAGYELGVGNQSIQVPFIERLHDASLFTCDSMVGMTLDPYPSFFFRLAAWSLNMVSLPKLYLALHLLTAVGVLVALAALCRAAFASHWAGFVAMMFLLAGHHHALAEEILYSTGFTHTWAVFPLALAALACFYADRYYIAFAFAGALFNFHALEAGYIGLAMGFVAVGSIRELGFRKLVILFGVFVALASPTFVMMLRQHQHFDEAWFQLMRIRSTPHSFPFAWWSTGQADVPRFLLILALSAVTLSLKKLGKDLRKTLLIAAAMALMFLAGIILTELWPTALGVRLQFFRSSKFLLVLALAYLAMGCVCGWSLPFAGSGNMAKWRGWLEFGSASVTALCVAFPSLVVLLPVALLMATLVALLNRRLLWQQALMAGVALLVCLFAWRSIDFVLPGPAWASSLLSRLTWRYINVMSVAVLAAAVGLWWVAGRELKSVRFHAITFAGAVACVGLIAQTYGTFLRHSAGDAQWVDAQLWARTHTPVNTLFLTPTQPGGFRIHSQRAIVGEWRDGTQLYFSANYAQAWWKLMNALQPGMRIAPDGKRLLVHGRTLSHFDDKEVIALAHQFGAERVVLAVEPARRLKKAYCNSKWAIYLPEIVTPSNEENNTMAEQRRFLEEVALPNIEKNRKSNTRLQVVDAGGRPVYDAQYRITQIKNSFFFGASLPFFIAPPNSDTNNFDFRPPVANALQLDHFGEAFNFSLLTYSAWWANIEPKEGQRSYEDLDRYLTWCKEHGITTEFGFLSGFPPAWLKSKPEAEQSRRLLQHAQDVVDRYADRVNFWQLSDQGVFLNQATNLVSALRAKHPQLKFGLSDATRFFTTAEPARRKADLMRGLDNLQRLKQQGIALDFVSLHGHQPWGLWADPKVIYEVLDAFAKEGVRIHISAVAVPSEGLIVGATQPGRWNPKLQAEYCRLFYTVCFSHPAVDVINQAELGPVTRWPGGGLLEADGKVKPAFETLRELFAKTWHTTLAGTLPLDGLIRFRGYHGQYQLEVTTTSGQVVATTFELAPKSENNYRFRLDAGAGGLTQIK
ncbi:MAG: beta-galactosidase [Verrucomicrobia bacterium]|nr:beta-galactosidase [Verrucomicrobiota bacterium]